MNYNFLKNELIRQLQIIPPHRWPVDNAATSSVGGIDIRDKQMHLLMQERLSSNAIFPVTEQ
jgi:hypothetical protein